MYVAYYVLDPRLLKEGWRKPTEVGSNQADEDSAGQTLV